MTCSRMTCVLAITIVLAACGEPKTYEPPAATAVERPTYTLDAPPGTRIAVPDAALVTRAGVPGVFVVTEQGQARFRVVRTGKDLGRRVEVLAGLEGNERLVLGDLRAVHDGTPVQTR